MSTRSKKPTAVADLVARFLAAQHGHPLRRTEAVALKVFTSFAAIGPPLTEHVEATSFRQGVLGLTVGDSTWLTELTFLRQEILDRVNLGLERPVVRDLRMRQGKLSRRPPPPKKELPKITRAQAEQIEGWTSVISNDEVREAVMRAAARSLARPKPLREPYRGPPGPRLAKSELEVVEPPSENRKRWPKPAVKPRETDRWKNKKKPK